MWQLRQDFFLDLLLSPHLTSSGRGAQQAPRACRLAQLGRLQALLVFGAIFWAPLSLQGLQDPQLRSCVSRLSQPANAAHTREVLHSLTHCQCDRESALQLWAQLDC